MATLGSRVAGRDRELFVARTDELAFFDEVLAGDSPVRIVHVVGSGGIGKSALLAGGGTPGGGARVRHRVARRS